MVFNTKIQASRQDVKKHDEYQGVLGNGSGNPYAGNSMYWVRFLSGTDANGVTTYTEARPVRYAGESSVLGREGIEVLVRRDPFDNVETITRIMPDYPQRAGIDSRILNSSDPINKWVDVKNFIRLLCRPSGGGSNTGTKVTIRENPFHVDAFGDWSSFTGTLPDDQPDLSSYIPTADNHRLVIVFFDFLANAPLVKASTTQALTSGLDSTDYDECFEQLPHNECIPLLALELADAQTTINQKAVIEDLRTWLPTPPIYGFPNPIPSGKSILLRSTHQLTAFDLTIEGELTIEGDLILT